jgi:ubiquinone/menaquinone biosynthesis C-methylase UbiE
MTDPTNRFSSKVENYVKYRPSYPPAVIDLLATECGLTAASIVADVGSGTGIFSELLLRHGNTVYGIEPNREMRLAAEQLLQGYPGFHSIDAQAEDTRLAESSVDIVTAGQAFHWFDQKRTRQEFIRILRPPGWVALLWNERLLDATPFLRAYEQLFLKYGTDYQQVRHENVYEDIASFYAGHFSLKNFNNAQTMDWEGLKGRTLSSSYVPEPNHSNYEAMLKELTDLFESYEQEGKVIIEYDTKVYYGRLK